MLYVKIFNQKGVVIDAFHITPLDIAIHYTSEELNEFYHSGLSLNYIVRKIIYKIANYVHGEFWDCYEAIDKNEYKKIKEEKRKLWII